MFRPWDHFRGGRRLAGYSAPGSLDLEDYRRAGLVNFTDLGGSGNFDLYLPSALGYRASDIGGRILTVKREDGNASETVRVYLGDQ